MPTTDLDTLRDRVEALLSDTSNADWDTDALDAAIRLALDELSQSVPAVADEVLDAEDGVREYDLSELDGLVDVFEVWYPYDADDDDYSQAHPVPFRLLDRGTLYLESEDAPDAGYDIRVWYGVRHTIEGLDSATETTLNEEEKSALVIGAAGYAAIAKARELMNQVTIGSDVPRALQRWGERRLAEFGRRLAGLWNVVAVGDDARVGGWD